MPPRKLGLKVALAGVSAYKGAATAVRSANVAIGQSALEAAQGGEQLDIKTIALGAALGDLASTALKAVLTGLKKLAASLFSMVKEAGPVRGLQIAFEGLTRAAGTSGTEMLAAMRRATGGMAAQKDMMMAFNRAASLVSKDFGLMIPDAMKYLGKVAFATGTDMNYLMNSLVVGIGRMSPMILDNMAIQVSLSESIARAAEMYGIEADALTKTQKQMGMANVVMEKLARNTAAMPSVLGTAAAGMGTLSAVIQDTKDQIGMALLPILGKMTTSLSSLANAVLPKLVPMAEAFSAKIIGLWEAFEKLLPAKEIAEALGAAFVEMKQGFHDTFATLGEIWSNWSRLIVVRGGSIVSLLRDRLVPAIQSFPDAVAKFWQRFGPMIQQAASYFTYFYRVVDDVFTGIRILLEGDQEKARKLFANAWNTAIAVVITILRNAAEVVVSWGKQLVAGYATGIIQGIKAYLAAALQSVAAFIRSFMAPGSAPKFLPDIGTWGAETMDAYLEGFTSADYGLLSQFTGQFKTELSKMGLDEKVFADTFFELRGVLSGVIADFQKTGKVAGGALDVIREKLGEGGIALAEMVELNLRLQQTEKELQRIYEAEAEIVGVATGLYEAGVIGAEEYEDIVKAAQKEREKEEKILKSEGKEMAEQLSLLEAQLAFHRETQDVLSSQTDTVEGIEKAIKGIGKAAKGVGDDLKEALEEAAEAAKKVVTREPAFDLSDIWGDAPKLDFGELLPDVEETKKRVAAFFAGLMDKAREAIMKSPLAQTILQFVSGKIIPAFEIIVPWLEENIPKALGAISTFWEETAKPALESLWEWLGVNIPLAIEILTAYWYETLYPALQEVWAFLQEYWIPILSGIAAMILAIVIPALIAWAASAIAAAASTVAALAPVILPILAIGLAVGLLVAAWQKDWGGIRTYLTDVWENSLKPTLETLWAWLSVNVPAALETLKGFWEGTLLPAIQTVWAFLTETLFPALQTLWTWLSEKVTGALQTLSDFWEETLLPALTAVWEFMRDYIIPLFVAVGELLGVVMVKYIEYQTSYWENWLLPALTKIWAFIVEFLSPIFEELHKFWEEKVAPMLRTLAFVFEFVLLLAWNKVMEKFTKAKTDVLEPIKKAFEDIKEAIEKVTDWIGSLAEKIAGFQIPDWAKGKSPPPLAIWFGDIAAAMREVADVELPILERRWALTGPISPMAGVGAATSIDQSVHRGPTEVHIQVQLSSGEDFARFKTMLRDVLNERG